MHFGKTGMGWPSYVTESVTVSRKTQMQCLPEFVRFLTARTPGFRHLSRPR